MIIKIFTKIWEPISIVVFVEIKYSVAIIVIVQDVQDAVAIIVEVKRVNEAVTIRVPPQVCVREIDEKSANKEEYKHLKCW